MRAPGSFTASSCIALIVYLQCVHLASSHRHKRGIFGGVFDFTDFVGQKDAQNRANEKMRALDEEHRRYMTTFCAQRCWDTWSAWGLCSDKCHSGSRSRTRGVKQLGSSGYPNTCRGFPCPGDRIQHQRCRIQCVNGGTSLTDICSCLPGFLGDCCENDITCPRILKPTHGDLGGVLNWPAPYDSVVTFSCLSGFALVGGPEHRRCLIDGTWSGSSNPKCEKITCTDLQSPKNGFILNAKPGYEVGDNIGFKCLNGFELRGANTLTCMARSGSFGNWSTEAPTCIKRWCGHPGSLGLGQVHGEDYFYEDQVTFTCNPGYKLVGPRRRRCLASGEWSSSHPSCLQIKCPQLIAPNHGQMMVKEVEPRTQVTFSCDTGFTLLGNSSLVCLEDENWNGTVPVCQAIECPDPGIPNHGSRDDDGHQFGRSAFFLCHEGYVLQGVPKITCLANGTWDSEAPSCQACPKDFYKVGRSDGGQCSPCPENSHTLLAAASTKEMCLCDRGYSGPLGGPCEEITCPVSDPPKNGRIVSCSNRFDGVCVYECDEGYYLARGSSQRACAESGEWDGFPPQCRACPINTYKADVNSCLPCPLNSRTLKEGSSRTECVCSEGFHGPPGGPCVDVNECDSNNGEGPCEQACENIEGGYMCRCTIAGYKLSEDGKTCKPAKQCTNLTETDAPAFGGLVCHWYVEENSQQCQVKCNPGYEYPTRTNLYETCGPATGFIWSFQRSDPNATIDPCVVEFFPDFRLEADSAYFVRACRDLTEDDKKEVRLMFAETLNNDTICYKRNTKLCDVKNIDIICGESQIRRRRDASGQTREDVIDSVHIAFDVFAEKPEKEIKNCRQICSSLNIPDRYCKNQATCERIYKRFLKAAMIYAKGKLEKLFEEDRHKAVFHAASRRFESAGGNVSDVMVDCGAGMESVGSRGVCLPCLPGTYYSKADGGCRPCPPGTSQSLLQQTSCQPCPPGMTTQRQGAKYCEVCPPGQYGDMCQGVCQCVHGTCDRVTGQCMCSSGWEGDLCDRDIPGCREGHCFQKSTCVDVLAPGTGFRCVTQ
ncbi:sushi, von Willebrand factor type A, EGF and pentraxin domain-containing protein 1 [Lingula anatina]|uniref:Sushi, von Willebrand factor type A, EGF and pentraxin domain-containing protein 1 n=1 Tax=Lingula anatina TaxID=7574 RepID=A0A1S3I7H0_LINAN|nr:sushi, von Willebrand factor type A, EGF and pentraxin domain-containing protein 1 [Lingula anatina]|eukprot:XP_013394148.1 sushi, von Willebrand factor type A, EGF and pentraxin domain-containing protein 1 [Lingula anatina]